MRVEPVDTTGAGDALNGILAAELARGATVKEVCKKLAITEQTYYRWRKEYGGLRTDQAKRFKQLEKENARLKKLLAEKELDLSILKEVAEGNF